MKKLRLSACILTLALFSFSQTYSQCDEGMLPATFQFVTCCEMSINNNVTYTIYNDAEEVVLQGVVSLSGAPAEINQEICLPPGCYYTTLSYSAGFNTSLHLESFAVVGEQTSSFNVFQTSQNIPFSFGFCVNETTITCDPSFLVTVENNGVLSVENTSELPSGFTAIYGWDYGDGANAQGFDPNHTYSENGIYDVCLFQAIYDGDIPLCVAEICTLVEMTTVPDNSGCPTEVLINAGEICGQYILESNAEVVGSNYWFVNDNLEGTNASLPLNIQYESTAQICLAHASATCESSTTVCTFLETIDCSNSNCPTEITVTSVGCHSYQFHVNNLGAFGNITWDFGDGETTGGQNNVTHTFDSLGVYTVCVEAFGSFCQDGIELCIPLEIQACGEQINCEGNMYSTFESNCGHVHFEAGNNPTNSPVYWNFGDGSDMITSTTAVLDHYFMEPGIYTVTALIAHPECPNNITMYEVVTIEDCFVDPCPSEMYVGLSQNNDCLSRVFEIGSYSPGESVIWHFGDGEIVTGGHFATHTYTTSGAYEVCATYISLACPNPIEICQEVVVDCGLNCELTIEQQPNICGYLVMQSSININVAEVHWSLGNETFIGSTVTIPATDGVYNICAWYNSEACIAPVEACQEVVVDNCTACTEVSFGFDSFINDGGTSYLAWNIYNANDLSQVESGMAQFSANDPYFDEVVCLEDGCYLLTAFNNAPFSLDAVIPQIGAMAEVISIDAINTQGTYGYEILLNINGACTADCDVAGFNYVSYPSYGGMAVVEWHLVNSNNQIVATGSNDFTPMEVNQSYYACLEEDCYTLTYYGNQPFEGNANFSHYLSGFWTSTEVTYGNIGDSYTMTVSLQLNSNCTGVDCTLELAAIELEPGLFEFTATGNPEVYPMIWNFGDGASLEATWVTNHIYTSPGVYTVCAAIETDACGVLEACTEIEVNYNAACDYTIWAGPGDNCGFYIFEISGGAALGPIVWNFGNEIVTDNQSIIHYFDTPGIHVITASGSSNACPNFQYEVTIEVPECNTCTPAAITFTSNVLEGSTNCVSASLTNLQTNEMVNELFEFTGNIQSHEWNHCLEDGCYSMTFDSCLPIAEGSDLIYNLFLDGESILNNALITYQDDYAMTFQFGVNQDCNTAACEANFEVIQGNEPGLVVINNLSQVVGAVDYIWNYGNGDSNIGNVNSYTYMQNGVYEICLTAINNLCTSEFCTIIEVTNSLCNETGVVITLTSDFQLPNMSDALSLMVTIEDNVLFEFILDVEPFNTYNYPVCIPDGCYNLELLSNNPLNALGIFATVNSNNNIIANAEILYGSYYGSSPFGLDCVDFVAESDLSSLILYPNPVDEQLTWKMADAFQIERVMIFDNLGRQVANFNPNERSVSVSELASGFYYLQIETADRIETRKFQIQH
jgi:PKD repeat protein